MSNIKINSIGFGYSKNIKLSEGLITAGTVDSSWPCYY